MDITKTEAYKQWQRDHERIQRGTRIVAESRQVQHARKDRAKKDYAFFVKTYFPHIARTACGKFQLDAASYILKNPNTRAVFEWARGHAKSTHMGVFIPMWLKIQDNRQFNTMVLVGKSEDSADRLLADLQSELEFNDLYIHDFGQQMKAGSWAEGEFTTVDGCYFTAVGRGQSPRGIKKNGRRPDYIVTDDIDDDELVLNEKRVSKATEWVLSALFGTMEAGRGRFILVGNRIAKKSILTNIAARPGVYHTVVNILDKKGRPSWSENYTIDEINAMRGFIGERNFQKEYMNNPMTEGAVFRAKDIRYGKMLPLKEYRQLICYTDPSFKNSATADYKATALVGKTPDGHFHVLKMFAAQTSVSEMIAWHYDIMEFVGGKVPVLYYMESNFMQDLMLDEFAKVGNAVGQHVPILGDKRSKGDKFARIESMQPLFERGLVLFNEKEKESPGMKVLEEQLLLFERGSRAHDDAPDALESAVWMLAQRTRATNARFAVIQRASRKF
ncbi:MAG: phage terminase large subunit [Bacteroidales bacterium]|nr:phage terminase large subunit [Bacteroidales bacterium]